MRFFTNDTGDSNAYYEPNSLDGPAEDAKYLEPPMAIEGDVHRYDHREGNDDYSQPGALFQLFDEAQRQRLFSNIAEAMQGVPEDIVYRQLGHFQKAHPEYALGVANALGVNFPVEKAA